MSTSVIKSTVALSRRSEEVEWQLVETLFNQTATLVIGGFGLPVIAIVAWLQTRQSWYVIWALAMSFTLVMRLIFVEGAFQRRTDRSDRVAFWRRRFTAGAWAMGSLWGCAGFVIVHGVDPVIQMLVLCVELVIVMGGAARNAGYPRAAYVQIFLGLTPVLIACLRMNAPDYYVLFLVVLLEMVAALGLMRHLNLKTVRFLIVNEENLSLVAEVQRTNAELARANVQLEEVATTDALTGIANRREFDSVLTREAGRAQRESTDLSLFMLDIDSFKGYNDLYGHLAGDDCLRRVAKAFALALRRPADSVARYGGEEFVAVLPQTDSSAAFALAETVRARIEALAIEHAAGVADVVTVSIGVATFSADRHHRPEDFIRAADEALYAAKGAGRNCVRVAVQHVAREGAHP